MPQTATKPYLPSNGTEGIGFEDRWCSRCQRDWMFHTKGAGGCSILIKALCGTQPREWVVIESGPTCLAFRERAPRKRLPPGWKHTRSLPGMENPS